MYRYVWLILFYSIVSCDESSTQPRSFADNKVYSSYKPRYAKGFEVQKEGKGVRIILYDLEHPGDTLQTFFWNTNAKRIACLSTTHIAMINKMGDLELLKATGYAQLVKNESAKKRIDENKIINLSSGEDIDTEKLLSVSPDLFLVYPHGNIGYNKYVELSIPCVPISEYLEESPLGRAEWIRLIGTLTGHQNKADSAFNEIEKSYLDSQKALTACFETSPIGRPAVFTGSHEGELYYAPPGNSFIGQLLRDAGANYLFADSIAGHNISLDIEEVIIRADTISFWGEVLYNPGNYNLETARQREPRFRNLKSFKNGSIFACNSAEIDYFGDALMEPDILLKDLIQIFHPECISNYKSTYFKLIPEK